MSYHGKRILVVDDHTVVRKGLREILISSPEFGEVDEAASAMEVFQKVNRRDYDCVLLDIRMPGRSGLDVLKQLKCMKPKLPVLILSMYPEEQYGIRALRAGAAGYVTKKIPIDELKKAIQVACKGQKYVTSSMAYELASGLNRNIEKAPHENLSDREFQILCMIASGNTVSQIARELTLSVKTISTHRSRILNKMNLQNNAQLTFYAVKQNLIQ